MGWIFLLGAIVSEVAGTLALKVAATGTRLMYVVVVATYLGSFVLLTLALDTGMGLGVAYGIWAALGVALTALLSRIFFGEQLTRTMLLGIGLIMLGVLAIEIGADPS
jgi:small multidrug resistance pump